MSGLINFQRNNKNNRRRKNNFWKENSKFLNLLLIQLRNKNLLELKEMLDFDLDVNLNSYSNYEVFKKFKPHSSKILL
ncbi:hypothetical protein KA001_00130 [Patescibacteria group bacterium]|nr:hypothetical protein [Patescibacteria group bacterium]